MASNSSSFGLLSQHGLLLDRLPVQCRGLTPPVTVGGGDPV